MSKSEDKHASDPLFFPPESEMARLIKAKDWSKTSLGPMEKWPQILLTSVQLCLASRFPIDIIWGPHYSQVYNDGYRTLCGDEAHPRALGENYSVTWASAWPALREPFERALAGETMFLENRRMFLTRNGYLEETFFTFSLSPIRDNNGIVKGLFHPVTETTPAVLSERRTRALRDLSEELTNAVSEEDVAVRTVKVLSRYAFDLPFVLFYRYDSRAGAYRLAAHCGMEDGPARSTIANTRWPVAEALHSRQMTTVESLSLILQDMNCGPYEEQPESGYIIPINVVTSSAPPALIITAASPRLPLNESYRSFYGLLAVTISGALATVSAREDERQKTEELAKIDHAKTAFFSNVSHEFRTPLTLMLGPLEELLSRPSVAGEVQKQLTVVHRNGLRMLRLVNSLLDFSRVEAGRSQASYQATDLAAFTADLASSFRSACEKAGLSLVLHCPPLSEPVYVDREMWEKIVLNLLSNAFKFTLDGKITVKVDHSGGQAVLTVQDTGIGIPKEELPHIFERFHRIETAHGRTYEGSGIGLALVQELVQQHEGTLTVQSKLRKGTTFTVRLPFGTAHLPKAHIKPTQSLSPTAIHAHHFLSEASRWLPDMERAQPQRSTKGSLEGTDDQQRACILFVDDNADMRDYVFHLLSKQYDVELAADGQQALQKISKQVPDLLLADVMMPGMDGFAFLENVRRMEGLDWLPVILLSARAGEESRIEGLEAGADDYLVKPFSAQELTARVRANIRLSRARRQVMSVLRQNEERKTFLLLLSDRLRSLSDALEIQGTAARIALDYFKTDRCYYCEIEGHNVLIRRDASDKDLPSVAGVYPISSMPVFKAVIDAGHPFIVQDASASNLMDEHLKALCVRKQVISYIDVPVIKNGTAVGMLSITQATTRNWTDFEVELAKEVAERTWAAVERAKAEEAFRRSEGKYRLLFNSIDEAVVWCEMVTDENGKAVDYRVLELNPAYEEMTGLTVKESKGKTAKELVPEIEDSWIEAYGKVAFEGKSLRFENKVKELNRWFNVYASAVGDKKKGQFVLVYRDITERRKAEETMRQSEERKAFLLKLSDELRSLVDAEEIQKKASEILGRHFKVNRTFYFEVEKQNGRYVHIVNRDYYKTTDMASLVGRYPEAFLGHFVFEKLEEGKTLMVQDVNSCTALSQKELKRYKAFDVQSFIVVPLTKEGRYVGGFVAMQGTPRDWTASEIDLMEVVAERTWAAVERAKTEVALQQSEENYRVMIDQSIAGILKVNFSGEVTFTNEQFGKMLGFRVPELLKLTVADLVAEEDQERNNILFNRLITEGKAYEIEKRLKCRNGSLLWVNNQISPIFDENGRPQSAVIISVDISRQKAIERQKDEFISIASHELKTPITSIKAYGQLLEQVHAESGNTQNAVLVRKMNRQIDRLTGLVYSLLDTTRISGGQLTLQPSLFDLNDLISEQIKDAQLIAPRHEMTFYPQKLPLVFADRDRIAQVLLNLISNAVKYSPVAGEITITCEPEINHVKVNVQDQGIGISAEKQKKIFDRFFRVSEDSTKAISGIGLGLYIAMEIVKKHNGLLGVESTPGRGSCFYFKLPYAKNEGEQIL